MMVFKKRQIVVLSLILMIVVAAYLQYNYKKNSDSADNSNNGKLGEAVYVDNADAAGQWDAGEKALKSLSASKQANDFFAQVKLEKETARSKGEESLAGITNDGNASKEVKNEAYQQMMKIIGNSDKEMRMENLIKEKGFEDAVTFFADDGSIDVVVKAPSLTSAQTAQIADIVSRQAGVSMDKIHIRNIY